MFSTKKQIYAFTRKVYHRLNHECFMVRFIRSKEVHGLCYKYCNFIEITADGVILATLVHEMLHDIYPEWTEKRVLKMERFIMNRLSHRQMINLIEALAGSLKRNLKLWNKIK